MDLVGSVLAFMQTNWGLPLAVSIAINLWLAMGWWRARRERITAENRTWRVQEGARREREDEVGRMQEAMRRALVNAVDVGQLDDLVDSLAERVAERLAERAPHRNGR